MLKNRVLARSLAISFALIVPCLWRPVVSPADMQSHLYNAWLADLISLGRVHGLYFQGQSTNVLVDLALAWLTRNVGVAFAEKCVAAVLILVFFWGAFRFIGAVQKQAAWWMCPWLAILSYGVVFQAGLLNFLASTGLVLWGLSFVWERSLVRVLAVLPLLGLAWVAHPVPVAWFVGVLGYMLVARRLPFEWQCGLCLSGLVLLVCGRQYLMANYSCTWKAHQVVFASGADQAVLYGWHYIPVAVGILGMMLYLFVARTRPWREFFNVNLQLYVLTAGAIVILPCSIDRAGVISQRLSLLACLLLLSGFERPVRTDLVCKAGVAVAGAFFALLYRDMGAASRMEAKIESLVAARPDARIISYLPDPPGYRVSFSHLASRACVGRCFAYQNYEPATAQFRIRALPGNGIVEADIMVVHGFEAGLYARQASDPPMFGVYRCGPDIADLCMREVRVGERGIDLARATEIAGAH